MDATGRFSDRVEDYVRYRPSYPSAVLEWLRDHGVAPGAKVADVGAGTGIWSSLLLEAGYEVWAVEPNGPMRAGAERWLGEHPRFTSVDGTAEATTLPDRSVELVTVAQAFHWFEPVATRREFARILQPGGLVVLLWNDRATEASPLMADYEQLLEDWGTDFRETTFRLRPLEQTFHSFFEGGFETTSFPNAQALDEDGFVGRFFSSSYTPARDDPRYAPAEDAARALFRTHQVGGAVELRYATVLYAGRVA